MMKSTYKILSIYLFTTLCFTACEVEEFANLNSPDLTEILNDPSLGDIQDLTGGVQAGMRIRLGTYYDGVGVIGREFYRFASSDPRFTADLLGRETAILDNNTFYITGPWGARYNTVKATNIVLEAVDITRADILDEEKNAIRGFIKTIQAHELLLNLNLTYENGIRTDVKDPENLGPFLGYDESLVAIRALLEEAIADLLVAGDTFPFNISQGFDGFDTPETFAQFSNALAARVAAYQGDLPAVSAFLEDSFLNLGGTFNRGIYYVFSSDGNDQLNPMVFGLNATEAGARIVHPSFVADAAAGDERLNKVVFRELLNEDTGNLEPNPLSSDELTGAYDFYVYPSNTTPIPILKNEELILLYAEANHISNSAEAVNAINIIRNFYGVPSYTGGTTPEELVDEILVQRRYSLYGEGHRWVDMRRFDRLDQLPIDRAGDDVWVQFPIPLNENQ